MVHFGEDGRSVTQADGQAHQKDWDHYWAGAGNVPVFGQFASGEDALPRFWAETFDAAFADAAPARMLDAACGSGAVTSVAREAAARRGVNGLSYFGIDYAASALRDLVSAQPGFRGVSGDCAAMPFADGQFDIVASQFGLEYAGPAAFAEAARLLAPGGTFVAVCHMTGGVIHRECADNLDTISALIRSNFLPRAKKAFRAGFALDQGIGARGAFEDANMLLHEATQQLKQIIAVKGVHAANALPGRLHDDVARMYTKRTNYEARDVHAWLDRMILEVETYAGRMRSMTAAALDEDGVRAVRDALEGAGLSADAPTGLSSALDNAPAAWIVRGTRPA